MKTVIIIVCCILVAAANGYYASGTINKESECGSNEEYKECGSPCIPTCNSRQFANCIAQCESGCFCKEGYIRKYLKGPCVPFEECRFA